MGNSQATEIPPTMRRIALTAPNSDMTKSTLIIEQVPMPTPQSGEVLIKVIAAPGYTHHLFIKALLNMF